MKPTLVQLILNAPAAAKNWLLASSAAAQKTLLSLTKSDVGLGNVDNTSDANKPISTATQAALDDKADLVGGVVPSSQIPAIAITEYLGSVANQTAMLALDGDRGDWCLRSDTGTTWVLSDDDSSLLASWVELNYPTAPVTSVNGETGAVTLSAADVGAATTSHTHAQSDITNLTTDLAAKAAASVTITAGTGLSGGGDLSANRTIDLENTAVTPGSYTSADITVDAQGRITAAANGSGGGGSPGGSSGQLQFNDGGSFGGAAAAVYAATTTHVTITSQSAAYVPFCVKGAASQSGNLTEWKNSAGTTLLSVSSGGVLGLSAANYISFGAFSAKVSSAGDVNLTSDNSAANSIIFGNNQGGVALRGVACTVYAFAGTALQLTSGAGSGTNGAASAFRLRAGASTGNATPASVLIQTTTAGASGSTAQTHRTVIAADGNTTAGETPMLLLDIDKGTLQRVSIGASDSGGTGFKVLRVPN